MKKYWPREASFASPRSINASISVTIAVLENSLRKVNLLNSMMVGKRISNRSGSLKKIPLQVLPSLLSWKPETHEHRTVTSSVIEHRC